METEIYDIHNWLVVDRLIPEVQKAVDSGEICEAGRAFA
jgi:hypothetical protein